MTRTAASRSIVSFDPAASARSAAVITSCCSSLSGDISIEPEPVPLEYVEPFGELGEAFTSGSGANPGMPPSASAEEPRTMPLCPARPLTPALAVIHVVS
jgi:hypothetical protein